VHYKFKGVELRTENAAKPYRQRSRWLVDQISQISSDALVLDYGCGKFRYTIPLSRRVRHVCAVDSTYQIGREQQIANKRTDLREYARKHLKNVSVHEVRSNGWRRRRFDFILCANVLSAIPNKSVRITVLRDLKRVLKSNGQLLATTQFRNTHFKKWKKDSNAIWAKDGWFVNGPRGASFYAIIPSDKLSQLCRAAGLVVSRIGSKGETAFVLTKRLG
jgi:2-polyprenyl-3-methyl-5-hydroxy-6-metoxy-1,4-benzoquinol methylase